MNPHVIIRLMTAAVIFLIFPGCLRHDNRHDRLWNTGCADIDSLLTIADAVDETGFSDPESQRPILLKLEKTADKGGYRDIAEWSRGRLAAISCDYKRAARRDSIALTMADSMKSPYLRARIGLDLSRALPDDDIERKANLLFGALPALAEANDSLHIMQALFDLNMIYAYVWDDDAQGRYLGEAAKFVPDSLPVLRALMTINVLGLRRGKNDDGYVQALDSLKKDTVMIAAVPPVGLMIGADLYRLRSDTLALENARRYERLTEEGNDRHPALWLYRTYRLKRFLEKGMMDSASTYAVMIETALNDETPYAMEMTRELIPYYRLTGNKERTAELEYSLHGMEEANIAYEKGRQMTLKSTDPRMESFMARDTQETDRHSDTSRMIIIVIAVGAASAIVWRIRSGKSSHSGNVSEPTATSPDAEHLTFSPEQIKTLRNDIETGKYDKWERFEILFTKVRPGFKENIIKSYPTLTPGELRLASLLSMGLETKHIAELLNIQPDSVKKARQRLRAKLGIPSDMTFITFLNDF